jgi:hypothetical protein
MNGGFVRLHPYFKAHPGKMDAITQGNFAVLSAENRTPSGS